MPRCPPTAFLRSDKASEGASIASATMVPCDATSAPSSVNVILRSDRSISRMPICASSARSRCVTADGVTSRFVAHSAIDGILIEPGDLVLGDADGLLAPFDELVPTLEAARHKMASEAKMRGAEGTLDTSWMDMTLKRLCCVGI